LFVTAPHLPFAHVTEIGSQHLFWLHAAPFAHTAHATSWPQLFFFKPHSMPAHVVAASSGVQPLHVPPLQVPASHAPQAVDLLQLS
jgi:hypothetical protein